MGPSGSAEARRAYWPATSDLQRVAEAERAGWFFDRVAAGCPECDVGWSEEQMVMLAAAASRLRRWLRYRINRLADHGEQACILGVSRPLLDRAITIDFRRIRERFAASNGGVA